MNKMNLSTWMITKWLPSDVAAEKYVIGQNLTQDQAAEIIQIIARSVNFNQAFPWARSNLKQIGPYRDFAMSILMLVHAGSFNHKWSDMLWDSLDPSQQDACESVMMAKVMGR